MKLLFLGAVVAAALLASPVIADEVDVAASAQAQASTADAEKESKSDMVCTLERPTGSNMRKRVCRSRAQRDAEAAAARADFDRSQQMGHGNRAKLGE